MKRAAPYAWLCLLLAWLGSVPARADEPSSLAVRRFVLLVGSNAGGSTRPELRYALSDAAAMARVFSELGGVRRGDEHVLENPDAAALGAAIARGRERVASALAQAQRTEFVFYYSGHSDDQGLRLGDALVPYPLLRRWLDAVRADVRIVVLDSCASGSFTRAKGGMQVAPFLFDASIDVRGQAVLTASAESEVAQESDRIRGSFFTHYLVSGLRGAADTSHDGRVTLSEAYRFAFDETLARTGTTREGAQHPSYDIRLSGSGDLVITDLRGTGARLSLAKELEGRLFVRDGSEQLVAEVHLRKGRPTVLSLPSGSYALLLEQGPSRRQARVSLTGGAALAVRPDMFQTVSTELAYARGDTERTTLVPVTLSLLAPYDNHAAQGDTRTYLSLNAAYGEPAELTGFALALGGNGAQKQADGALFALLFNRTRVLRGVALSGVANANRERMVGLELAGLFNLDREETRGVSLTMGFNSARRSSGLKVATLNFTHEQARGLDVAALQVAGETRGFALGGVNYSRQLVGLQVGALNLAGQVQGAQVGALNIAHGDVRGVQFGLVNYAHSVDAGLAPFSITREGGVHAQLTTGALALLQAALRFDARYTYSFLGVNYHPLGTKRTRSYGFGGGFGGKIPLWQWISAEVDTAAYLVQPLMRWQSGVPHLASELRVLLRFEIHKYLSVVSGLSLDVLVDRSPEQRLRPGQSDHFHRATRKGSDVEVRYGPGWVVGLRL